MQSLKSIVFDVQNTTYPEYRTPVQIFEIQSSKSTIKSKLVIEGKQYVEQRVEQLESSQAIFFFGFYIAVMFISSDILSVRMFGGKALCCCS